jgi:hypothetical protein
MPRDADESLVEGTGKSVPPMTSRDLVQLIDGKFREGLAPCQPAWVDVEELPGEQWLGLWRVTVWGEQPLDTAAWIDVPAGSEAEAIDRAYAALAAWTREEWLAEMPVEAELAAHKERR